MDSLTVRSAREKPPCGSFVLHRAFRAHSALLSMVFITQYDLVAVLDHRGAGQ